MRTLIAILLVVAGQAQTPQRATPAAQMPGAAVISGQVVGEDEAARPVRQAKVTLSSAALRREMMAITDGDGRFVFSQLPAGRYTISVSKPGFASVTYGAKRPGGSGVPVVVADGERPSIAIRMPRGAVIAGTIRGAEGDVASGVRLQVLKYGIDVRGARVLQNLTFSNSGNGLLMTDDRGAYRIYGLSAGEYYVQATVSSGSGIGGRVTSAAEIEWAQRLIAGSGGTQTAPPPPGQTMTLAPVLFPGTADPAAAIPITLKDGEERTGVDFALAFTPTATVSGIVLGPDGSPPKLAQGSLIRPNLTLVGGSLFIRPDTDGRFTVSGVVPGEYVLAVRGSMQSSTDASPGPMAVAPMPLWAMADVSISGQDISGLELRLAPGAGISGKIVFDGVSPLPDVSKVSIGLQSQNATSMGTPSVVANADGTFLIPGVGPGEYKIVPNIPAVAGAASPWTVRSALVGGVDVLDGALSVRSEIGGVVITFTDRPTEITGSLLNETGKPAPEYYIVAFPADRAFWTPQSRRVRSVRPGTTGSFRIAGLPPGEYYLCAMTDLEQNLLNTTAYLESLVGAAWKLSLAEGEKKIQDLKIAGR